MGVSGAGKSTVAAALADRLGWPFQEGDALHPPANVRKMQAGQPLTDQDRAPWLRAIRAWIDAQLAAGQNGLITCSALKRSYRQDLIAARPQIRLLYLQADKQLLATRLAHRTDHFMPPTLLESQLSTLEEPTPEENPLIIPVDSTPAQTIEAALKAIAATNN